jgi:hypothetical protein
MSAAHSSHHGATSGPAAGGDDQINIRKIILVGGISLAIFALSAVLAYVILEVDTERLRSKGQERHPGAAIGQDEIGIIDQVHFDADKRLEQWKSAKRKRLDGYGWSDRRKGLIHIPIEDAMKEVVQRASAAGSAPAEKDDDGFEALPGAAPRGTPGPEETGPEATPQAPPAAPASPANPANPEGRAP